MTPGNPNRRDSVDRPSLDAELELDLERRRGSGLLRTLSTAAPDPSLIDFLSNDYLGMSRHPEVIEAAADAIRQFGAGSRASRLLRGGTPLHPAVETAAAAWLRNDAALLFPSGYQANLGLLCALAGRDDLIFSDERNHASLIDAARLSRSRVRIFQHLDLGHLDHLLARSTTARRRLVVTESIFSMDGDLAPLAELHDLCEKHDAWLIVDEAHAVGLLGPEGAGGWAALKRSAARSRRLVARIVTGGKALGVAGALVVCSDALASTMVNQSRSFIYTTATPPAVAGALLRAIELTRSADDLRQAVLSRARQLTSALRLPTPAAAIVPFVQGGEDRTIEVAARCRENGFDVLPVRPPTVPVGTSRLRIVCHAHQQPADLDRLAGLLGTCREDTGVPAVPPPLASALFVVGTDTDVGKTVVSALLVRQARALGAVKYWKPVQTGSDLDVDTVRRLADTSNDELLPTTYQFPLPASPHEAAAAVGECIDPAHLDRIFASHRAAHPEARIVIEPAGGLLVPLTDDFTLADWLPGSSAKVVLVARSGLGTLNHTLLTVEALSRRGIDPQALFLVGEPHPSNRNTLARLTGIQQLHEIPGFDPLDGTALGRWLDDHDLSGVFA